MRRLAPLLALLALAAPAEAQVFVDPESPTGKEYALPLEEARRQAAPAGGGAPTGRPAQPPPLFGEGIERGTAPRPGARPRPVRPGTRPRPAAPRSPAAREAVRAATARPGAPRPERGSTLLVLGGAALVLALGAAGGLALRRRAR